MEGNRGNPKPCRSSRGCAGITRKRGKVEGDNGVYVGGWTCPRIALMRSGSDTDPAMGQYVGDVSRGRIEKPTTPWSLRAVPPERRYARGEGGARWRDDAGERGQGAGARGQGAQGRGPPANRGLPALPRAQDEAEDDGEGTPPADEQSKSKSRERRSAPPGGPRALAPFPVLARVALAVARGGTRGSVPARRFLPLFCIWTRDFLPTH